MRTIDKLIYRFTKEEKKSLKELNIINGCWGKWFSLEWIFSAIKLLARTSKNVKLQKLSKLFGDFQTLCNYKHDIDFHLWGWIKDFYKSNNEFIDSIMILLYWSTVSRRKLIYVILYISLNSFGLLFFAFREKKLSLYKLKKQLKKD